MIYENQKAEIEAHYAHDITHAPMAATMNACPVCLTQEIAALKAKIERVKEKLLTPQSALNAIEYAILRQQIIDSTLKEINEGTFPNRQ